MPFYHATHRHKLPSIYRHGLGGSTAERNFSESEPGVYVAEDPVHALSVLLEHALDTAEDHESPKAILANFIFIVIDDARLDRTLLRRDPNVAEWAGFWIYPRTIDVTNMPILDLEHIMPMMAADPN